MLCNYELHNVEIKVEKKEDKKLHKYEKMCAVSKEAQDFECVQRVYHTMGIWYLY